MISELLYNYMLWIIIISAVLWFVFIIGVISAVYSMRDELAKDPYHRNRIGIWKKYNRK